MQMEVTLQVKNVTIIGSGLMGHGIALKFAQYNCNVIVYDPNDVSLDSLFERIEISLSQMEIKKEEIKKIISSISKTNNLCLLYTSPSPRDVEESRMPSSA